MKKVFFMLFVLMAFVLQSISLDQILEKNYKTYGGKEKLASIKTVYMEGKIVQGGMEMPIKVWYKVDGKFRMEATVMQQKMVTAFDGKIAWWIMPMIGINEPQKMPEEQREQFMEQMDQGNINSLFDYKKKGYKLIYLGEVDLDGTPVYKLELIKKNNEKIYHYLDKDSCVVVKTEIWKKKGDNEVHIETYPSEYNMVDGILFAHSIEVSVNGNNVTTIAFTKVKINDKFSDDIFDMNKQE